MQVSQFPKVGLEQVRGLSLLRFLLPVIGYHRENALRMARRYLSKLRPFRPTRIVTS